MCPPATAPPPPEAARESLIPINLSIWRAFAGQDGRIPTVGSTICYFPQGHIEHSSSIPNFSAIRCTKPYFRCRVLAVRHLADPATHQVVAKILLDPRITSPPENSTTVEDPDDAGVTTFEKILTDSDAGCGGAFTVPKECAVSIFPPLNLTVVDDDLPAQNLEMRDVLGNTHSFRHVFRGKPQRHLLTTGWTAFVRSKNLIAGDSVVFVRNREGGMFVGIKRRRQNTGRSSAESAVEAVRLAESNRPFEVDYRPMNGSPVFVVAEEKVEAAMRVRWMVGSRVTFSEAVEINSPPALQQGTVSEVGAQYVGPWALSPWRMLKVTWDENNTVLNVSPWQVELMPGNFQNGSSHPTSKRLRISPDSELPSNGGGSNIMTRNSFPLAIGFINSTPDGIQGARQDPSVALRSFNSDGLINDEISQDENSDAGTSQNGHIELSVNEICNQTKQGCGNTIRLFGQTVNVEQTNEICNQAKQEGIRSIQLFGQTVNVEQPCDEDATPPTDS